MKIINVLVAVNSLTYSLPQSYNNNPPVPLESGTLENIGDIFGKTPGTGYGSQPHQGPDDYVEPQTVGDLRDKATTEVDKTFENCADYTESLGYECVPYYQCHNGTIITDGAGLIDIRNGFGVLTPEDSKCPGFLDVCCKDPDFVPPPPPKLKYQPKCGQRNQNGLGVRIQGFRESESQFGEWPHMCAVLHETVVEDQQIQTSYSEPSMANLYQCGGSLIAPGVILTAAHCVDKFRGRATELKVRCGEWDTQNETEPYAHQDRQVKDIEIHPLFNSKSLASDWAILFTSEDFILSSHIDTVCLPKAGEVFDDTSCFATGWGKDKFGSAGEYQVVLKEVDLPVVDHATCQYKLRQTRLGHRFKLHDSFICAGAVEGKDTCKGDGGSPLVCPSKSDPYSYVQAGVVAWGIGCGENGIPGVYASVSKAACWIDHVMSCYHGALSGDYSSINEYSNDVCLADMNSLVQELEDRQKSDGHVGHYGRFIQAQINKIQQCQVNWQGSAEPRDSNEDLIEKNREGFNPQATQSGALPVNIIDNSLIDQAYANQHSKGSISDGVEGALGGSSNTGAETIPSPVY